MQRDAVCHKSPQDTYGQTCDGKRSNKRDEKRKTEMRIPGFGNAPHHTSRTLEALTNA
jgi:hypothetical protein